MVSTEDVPSLISALCCSFVNPSTKFFTTKLQKQQLKKQYARRLQKSAFDRILFDYDEDYCEVAAHRQLDNLSSLLESANCDVESSKEIMDAVNLMRTTGNEDSLKVLTFLLPLMGNVQRKKRPVIGYGELPPTQTLTRDILEEDEIFRHTPLLAPSDVSSYTYYPPSLFTDSVATVTDSAFSDMATSCCSDSLSSSHFPICDPNSFLKLPASDENSLTAGTDWLMQSTTSFYGALTNSYRSEELQTYLELPPIDTAPILFDSTSQSQEAEDKTKVQSAEVTLNTQNAHFRSDSGLGGEFIEEPELGQHFQPLSWELKRRCGGYVGRNVVEKPYLTEAGPEVFDILYRLQLSCELQINSENREERRHLYIVTMSDLMSDLSRLLIGVSSQCFTLDTNSDSFSIKQNLVMSGLSAQSLAGVCQVLVDAGTHYHRLNKLCQVQVSGLTISAFLSSVSQYLTTYTAVILNVTASARSPLHLRHLLKKHLVQIRLLAELCYCADTEVIEYPPIDLPDGVYLLSYIYKQAESYSCHYFYHFLLSLLQDTCQPYLRFLQDWVFHGRCSDPYEEFIVTVDPYKLEAEDRSYWTDGYSLDKVRNDRCLFVDDVSERMFVGGKSLALLRRIAPDHEILMVKCEAPRLDICLTEDQQLDLGSQSTVYIETVNAVINHKVYTREMMLVEKEQKRAEVIRQAQARQAEKLAEIYKKINEAHQQQVEKKKKAFKELKENMEVVAARKQHEEEEEKKMDKELMEKLTKREQLQTEADARLEQQARDELIEYYRLMSETAAARERKALWRVRRHQLSAAREQWFIQRQQELDHEIAQLSTGASVTPESKTPKRKWEKPEHVVIKVEAELEQSVEKNEVFIAQEDLSKEAVTSSPAPDDVKVTMTELKDEIDSCKPGGDFLATSADKPASTVSPQAPADSILPQTSTPVTATSQLLAAPDKPLSADYTLPAVSTDYTLPAVSADYTSPAAPADVSLQLEEVLRSGSLPLTSVPFRRSTKSVKGQHASLTTFDKEYLITRSKRKVTLNMKEKEDQIKPLGNHVLPQRESYSTDTLSDGDALKAIRRRRPVGLRRSATMESDMVDSNVVRLNKFRLINKKGHASHSSIQDLMYYETAQEEDNSYDELLVPAIQPIRLQDVDEKDDYDKDFNAECKKPPYWLISARSHGNWSSEGVCLYEHVTLPTLLHQSIAPAINAQISMCNQAVLSYFMVELDFDKHMSVLHNYLLLAKGEFCHAFTSPLFEKLHACDDTHPQISTYFLTDTLSKALQHAPLKDNQFIDNVTISKGQIPRLMETYTLNAFSWLSLTYKVPWPMNILITPEHIEMYEKVFSFMISLKHISYLLADSLHSLRLSTQTHSLNSESQQYRQLHLIRHDMQHFVKVIHGYLALQVTQVSWHQFQTELKTSVKDLDSLYESHNRFINRCLLRCFLSHKVQQIKQVVDGILKSIYKFHALLRLGYWQQNDSGEFVHTEYQNIVNAYIPFWDFTQFLNKVLNKMTEFDKNQHLQELQIMLNFNGYYSKPTGHLQ